MSRPRRTQDMSRISGSGQGCPGHTRGARVVMTRAPRTVRRRSGAAPLLFVLVVQPGQPGGQALDGGLELGMDVGEHPQLLGEPGEADLLLAAAVLQLLDSAIGVVHTF